MADAESHGETPAAWTSVTIVMVGFLIGSIAVIVASPLWFWIAVGVIVLGVVVGKVMQMMGMGTKAESSAEDRA